MESLSILHSCNSTAQYTARLPVQARDYARNSSPWYISTSKLHRNSPCKLTLRPLAAQKAASESKAALESALAGTDMVFVTVGGPLGSQLELYTHRFQHCLPDLAGRKLLI